MVPCDIDSAPGQFYFIFLAGKGYDPSKFVVPFPSVRA